MSLTASVSIKGYVRNYGYGRAEIDTAALTNASSVPSLLEVTLANGNNTITVPSGAKACIITMDPASTRTKILKGANGDTGIQISVSGKGGSMMIPLYLVSSFVINSSGADTTITRFQFI